MKFAKRCFLFLAIVFAMFNSAQTLATQVLQMNLAQMVERSDRIFRGTVLEITEGRVEAGGGEIPALTYKFQVEEAFKGNYSTVKNIQVTEFKMVGTLKHVETGRAPIAALPLLQVGREYVLLVAPEGPVGLTSTIGLAQGCFDLTGEDSDKIAINGFQNTGLFSGMDVPLTSGQPVSYTDLADTIRQLVGGAD